MQSEPLLNWSEPVTQFIGFVALFLATGAVGFRYAAVRNRFGGGNPGADAERTVYAKATRRAATLGLVGATVQAVLFVMQLPSLAARAPLDRSAGDDRSADRGENARCCWWRSPALRSPRHGAGVDGH